MTTQATARQLLSQNSGAAMHTRQQPETALASSTRRAVRIGFGWLVSGVWGEVGRVPASQPATTSLAWFTLSFMADPSFCACRSGWRAARYPAIVTAPFLLVAVSGNLFFERSNLLFNVLLWPACPLLHLFMLGGVDDERPRRWWPVVHVGNAVDDPDGGDHS